MAPIPFTMTTGSDKELLVLKFGGTSVGTGARLVHVSNIIKGITDYQPIVVLSAMSGADKANGTTSRLLEASTEILKPQSQKYLDIVDSIERDHLAAAKTAFQEAVVDITEIKKALEKDIQAICDKLRAFMAAAEIIDELSPRSQDYIVSAGERLSALIFVAVLRSQGIKAKYVNLERIVTRKFERDAIDQKFYDYLTETLGDLLQKDLQDYVCVATGYLGPVPGGIVGTIGRGYTDLTAALIAVGISASELQIWKEVDGIYTADPRKVPRAQKIHSITPEEAAELTYYGSEVIHPFTMEQVIRASIPIRIKNTFKPEGLGTLIVPEGHRLHIKPESTIRQPTAVTIKDNVIVLNVHSNRKSVSHGFLAQIFLTLDKYGIVVDLISTSEVHISIALNPSISRDKLDRALTDLKKYGDASVMHNMAILSLVGMDMRNMVGVASNMFSTLARHKVNIEMISQGASEINISCVIDEEHANIALRAIHDEILLSPQ